MFEDSIVSRRRHRDGPPLWLVRGAALVASLLLAGPAASAVFYVNNDNDAPDLTPGDGECWTGAWVSVGMFGVKECSLRAAIQETNALGGADEVRFANQLPTDSWGSVVIRPTSALPFVSGPLKIDGTVAPGFDANDPGQSPIVVLDGTLLAGGHGLYFTEGADASELLSLAIIRFPATGVVVAGADGMLLQGNHIGLYRGITPLGNGGHGLQVQTASTSTVIGHAFDATLGYTGRGNVICGNGGNGLYVGGSFTYIAGNHIGTDRLGNTVGSLFGDYSNAEWGVRTYGSGSNILIGRVNSSTTVGDVASGNTIAGNDDGGILVDGSPQFVSIYANHIGIGSNGTTDLGNGTRSGIDVKVDGVTIGDAVAGGNVISGHDRYGVEVSDPVTGLSLVGNVIGLNAAADTPVPNLLEAVLVIGGSDGLFTDNVVGGNGDDGFYLNGDGHRVQGNYVGTNAAGDDLGNGGWGIATNGVGNVIGQPYAGNVVGFNDNGGVVLDFANDSASVLSNWIGVDPTGRDIGNDGPGLVIRGDGNWVGGHAPEYANTIGNNAGHGIDVRQFSTYCKISGNYIGTDVALADHGNAMAGIRLDDTFRCDVGSDELVTDAEIPIRRNVIAWNGGDGVRITQSGTGFRNAVRGNYFHENADEAIDLEDDGPTANDVGDYDGGANLRQNWPVLDPAHTAFDWPSGELDVRYRISSETSQSAYPIRVDFYAASADGAAPGEWLGSDVYASADAMLDRDTTIVPAVPLVGDETIVAIATTDDGNSSEAGNFVSVPEPGFAGLVASGGLLLSGLGRRRRAAAARAA